MGNLSLITYHSRYYAPGFEKHIVGILEIIVISLGILLLYALVLFALWLFEKIKKRKS